MIKDINVTELEHAAEDPAGGVLLPPSRPEVVRASALAGVRVGFGGIACISVGTIPTTSISV